MEMKWNPIVNGDLSEVPCDEEVIFTVLDEETGEVYTATAEVNNSFLEHGRVFVGELIVDVDFKTLKAWMKLPEPFNPGRCDMCKHMKQWTDEFGDNCAECELIENPPFIFPTMNPITCPFDR